MLFIYYKNGIVRQTYKSEHGTVNQTRRKRAQHRRRAKLCDKQREKTGTTSKRWWTKISNILATWKLHRLHIWRNKCIRVQVQWQKRNGTCEWEVQKCFNSRWTRQVIVDGAKFKLHDIIGGGKKNCTKKKNVSNRWQRNKLCKLI